MSLLATDIAVIVYLVAQAFFLVAAFAFALSGLDDLAIDALFYIRALYRRLAGRRSCPIPDRESLLSQPEKPLALMLPAWQEAPVLFAAVENILATVDYSSYEVFLGTYPNDSETQREADRLVAAHPRVHKIVTPHPGPTCKADCLNSILSAIADHEKSGGFEFAGIIMQDAEDVVHPMSLRLFNFLLEDYDLIQIPVLSLPRRTFDLIGAHYMDEFAEFHGKEIHVRSWLTRVVPGAGVGTAYARRLVQPRADGAPVFNIDSLTEDYEFSHRMAGTRQIFACFKDPGAGAECIATREYFPNRFVASFRQKARWTIGISFQGWRTFGWRGSLAQRYFFWRDRKMILFSHGVVIGWIAIVMYAGLALYDATFPAAYHLPPLLPPESPVWNVVWLNVGLLIHRVVQRHIWCVVFHGVRPALLAGPRYLVAITVNYFAMLRATRIYARHLRNGRPIGWDKTSHDFPDRDLLEHAQRVDGGRPTT